MLNFQGAKIVVNFFMKKQGRAEALLISRLFYAPHQWGGQILDVG